MANGVPILALFGGKIIRDRIGRQSQGIGQNIYELGLNFGFADLIHGISTVM